MRPRDALLQSLEELGDHKLRTSLTMLGMMFGVGAVIAMLSIGAGAEHQALELIDRLGVRNVVVRAKERKPDELKEIRKKSVGLSERDEAAILESVPGVAFTAPKVSIDAWKVLSATGKGKPRVYGVSHRHAEVVGLRVAEGRWLGAEDERHHAQVAVIGDGARRALFGAGDAVGRDIKVNDVWLEVVGVLAREASAGGSVEGIPLGSTDDEVYLPVTTALRKFERDPMKSPLNEIVVRLSEGAPARETGAVIAGLVDRLQAGSGEVEVVVPEALLRQSQATRRLFNLVMGLIAGISLLVGGIGIMNIMLASVMERTKEIGVRRAVGARRTDIQFQFLVTAFTLALLGGLVGVGVGLAISRGVAAYAEWPTVVTPWSIALSLGVSVTVGLVSGLYPAIRASKLDPIQCLHYE